MMKRYINMPLKKALPLLFICALVLVSIGGCTSSSTSTATPTVKAKATDAFSTQSFVDQVNAHENGAASKNVSYFGANDEGRVDAIKWGNDTTLVSVEHFNTAEQAAARYNSSKVGETIIRTEAPLAWGLNYYTNVTGHAPTVKKVETVYSGGDYLMHQTVIQYDNVFIMYSKMDNPSGV